MMRRALLIPLVAVAYVGCSGRVPPGELPVGPVPRGAIRLLVEDESTIRSLLLPAVGRPLVSSHLARRATKHDIERAFTAFTLPRVWKFVNSRDPAAVVANLRRDSGAGIPARDFRHREHANTGLWFGR